MLRLFMTNRTLELRINAALKTYMSTQAVMSGITITTFGTFKKPSVR